MAFKLFESMGVNLNVEVFAMQDDLLSSMLKMHHYVDPCTAHGSKRAKHVLLHTVPITRETDKQK